MSDADDFYNFNRGRAYEKINTPVQTVTKTVQVQDYGAALAIAITLKEVRAERDRLQERVKELECKNAAEISVNMVIRKEIENCPHDHAMKDAKLYEAIYSNAYRQKAEYNRFPVRKWPEWIKSRMKIYEFPMISSQWKMPNLDANEAKNSWYFDSWVYYTKHIQSSASAVHAVNGFLVDKLNKRLVELDRGDIRFNDRFKDDYFSAYFATAKEIEFTPTSWPEDIKKFAKEYNLNLKEYRNKDGYDILYDDKTRNTMSMELLQRLYDWVVAARKFKCHVAGLEAVQVKLMKAMKDFQVDLPISDLEKVYDGGYMKAANEIQFPKNEWAKGVLNRNS